MEATVEVLPVDDVEAALRFAIGSLAKKARAGEISASEVTALIAAVKTLNEFRDPQEDDREQLREVERRARLIAGIPPRNAEEWAWAERSFTPDAVAEFRRWADSPDED